MKSATRAKKIMRVKSVRNLERERENRWRKRVKNKRREMRREETGK